MPYTKAQKRAIQKYRQTEKGKEYVSNYSKEGRVQVQFNLATKSEQDIITAIEQLTIPKGQYAKTAFIEKLVRDGYLTENN